MSASNTSHGFIYTVISNVIFIFSAYALNVILARLFGPEKYGTWGILTTTVSTVNLLQTSGLPQGVAKFVSSYEEKKEEIFKSGFVLYIISTIIICLLFYFSAPLVANLLNDLSLIYYLQLSTLVFPAYGLFTLYVGYYNGLHNFKKQAIINSSYSIAKFFVIFILAYFYGLIGALIGFALAPFFAVINGFHLPSRHVNSFPYKKLILFSIPLIGIALFSILQRSIDIYFVKGILSSDSLVGFYNANQNLASIPFYALSAVSIVLFPSIARSITQNTSERTMNMIQDAIRYTLFILLPSTVAIVATSVSVIDLIFSDAFLPAAPSLAILIVSYAFLTLFSILTNVLSGAGSPTLTMIISIVGTIVTAIACYLLIPVYALEGAAVATGIGGFVSMVLAGYFVYKKFGVLVSFSSVVKILIASLGLYFVASSIKLPPVFLPINYLVSGTVYILLLFILKEIQQKDIDLALSFVPASVSRYFSKKK